MKCDPRCAGGRWGYTSHPRTSTVNECCGFRQLLTARWMTVALGTTTMRPAAVRGRPQGIKTVRLRDTA